MITRITNGNVLIDGVFQKVDLYLEGKTIVSIGQAIPFDRDIDAGGNYVTAGFIDLHCHGGGGADFSDGDRDVSLELIFLLIQKVFHTLLFEQLFFLLNLF